MSAPRRKPNASTGRRHSIMRILLQVAVDR